MTNQPAFEIITHQNLSFPLHTTIEIIQNDRGTLEEISRMYPT